MAIRSILVIVALFLTSAVQASDHKVLIPGCAQPENFRVESVGYDTMKLAWNSGSSNTLPSYYEFRYRTVLPDEVGSWYPVETQYPASNNSVT